VIVLSAVPIRAQKGTPPAGGVRRIGGSTDQPESNARPFRRPTPTFDPGMQPQPGFGVFVPPLETLPKPVVDRDETCLPGDLPAMAGATVSAIRLGFPQRQEAITKKLAVLLRRKKFTEAEQHVRVALRIIQTTRPRG